MRVRAQVSGRLARLGEVPGTMRCCRMRLLALSEHVCAMNGVGMRQR